MTYNSVNFIKPCLDSVFTQGSQDLEVIVVDNGSKDATVSLIKENYPQVILIENKENLGACRGRNLGIKASGGEWVLTLDSDVILEKDFLEKMIKFAEEAEDSVGIFQPKILNINKKTIYSCGIYLSKLRRFYDIGKGKFDNGQFNTPKYIFGACSASALYRKSMLEEIKEKMGYFDERFFFLVEDVDLAWRAQKNGWQALYMPCLVCYHYGNSSACDKGLRRFLCFRNRLILIRKNENILGKIKLIPIFFLYDLPRLFFNLFNLSSTLLVFQFFLESF